MRIHKLRSFLILLILSFLLTFYAFIIPLKGNIANATAPNPDWWVDNNLSFSQYDDYQYKNGRTHQGTFHSGSGVDSYILSANASYDGVTAVGPRPYGDGVSDVAAYFTTDANATQELEWECVELVKRFLYLKYGVRSIVASGYQVVDNYESVYPTYFKVITNNGSAQVYPKAGDVLSYNSVGGDNGHTVLVKSVTNQSGGSATVELIEQNASSSGVFTQTFNNWQFQNGIDDDLNDPHTVSGWLTPDKGSWTNTCQMKEAISKHTATLLPDGKVLVAGGYRSSYSVTNRSELYGPTPGAWSYTNGNLNTGRYGHTADLVTASDGATRVLVTGGYGTTYLTSSELYNPSAGTWLPARNMQTARYYHKSVKLNDGTVLVIGGTSTGGVVTSSVELYDPVNNTWTTKASLNKGRRSHTATLLNDGRVLVTGGLTSSNAATSSAELYTPSGDTWYSLGPVMSNARYGHSATLLPDGRVLIAGGITTSIATKSAEVFDPASDTFSAVAPMNYAHAYHPATLMTLSDNSTQGVLVSGSCAGSDPMNAAELYDYVNNRWRVVANMNYDRCTQTGTLLNDNTVLDAGYWSTQGSALNSEYFTAP